MSAHCIFLKLTKGWLWIFFVVCLFVCWNKTRKTVLRLLCWEGSKTPGSVCCFDYFCFVCLGLGLLVIWHKTQCAHITVLWFRVRERLELQTVFENWGWRRRWLVGRRFCCSSRPTPAWQSRTPCQTTPSSIRTRGQRPSCTGDGLQNKRLQWLNLNYKRCAIIGRVSCGHACAPITSQSLVYTVELDHDPWPWAQKDTSSSSLLSTLKIATRQKVGGSTLTGQT